jgi:hypothetical protein
MSKYVESDYEQNILTGPVLYTTQLSSAFNRDMGNTTVS